MPGMNSVCDSASCRDYHNDIGSRIPRFGDPVRFNISIPKYFYLVLKYFILFWNIVISSGYVRSYNS
jgi:hypothetical protein